MKKKRSKVRQENEMPSWDNLNASGTFRQLQETNSQTNQPTLHFTFPKRRGVSCTFHFLQSNLHGVDFAAAVIGMARAHEHKARMGLTAQQPADETIL
jgi:hypothetical protein